MNKNGKNLTKYLPKYHSMFKVLQTLSLYYAHVQCKLYCVGSTCSLYFSPAVTLYLFTITVCFPNHVHLSSSYKKDFRMSFNLFVFISCKILPPNMTSCISRPIHLWVHINHYCFNTQPASHMAETQYYMLLTSAWIYEATNCVSTDKYIIETNQ